jgi:hypothetical protein
VNALTALALTGLVGARRACRDGRGLNPGTSRSPRASPSWSKLFSPLGIEVNFVQFSRGRAGRTSGAHRTNSKPTEDAMKTLATRLVVTASIAALICATPASIDLVRAGAVGTTHLALALDTAQAHEVHGGHGAAGEHHASHESGRRAGGDRAADASGNNFDGNGIKADNVRADNVRADDIKANNVRANNFRANDVTANNIRANNVRANDINANDVRLNNVNVNDVNATRVNAANVNATYVRPPYIARPWGVGATASAVAVGTTVAVLPASCTVVDYNGVTYHHCGDTYYVASDGAYVAVNPPR